MPNERVPRVVPADPTARQRQIVEIIRERASNRQPLNLTAMTRANPDLIREVFAMRPFWGWRRAIEDAGLTYDEIPIELEETVECLVCGRRLKVLSGHIAAQHGLSAGAYRSEFPRAFCNSEVIRAARMSARPVPHWEPIWSPEYVVDRVRYLYDRGHSVNWKSVSRSDPPLLHAARAHWGEWDAALRAADLVPDEIRLLSPINPVAAAEEVIAAITERRRLNLPLNPKALNDASLMYGACKRFGSWRRALIEAGVRPSNVYLSKRHRPGAAERLLKQARKVALISNEGEWRLALTHLRKRYSNLAYRLFGGWTKVARLIGVRADRLLLREAYTRDEIVAALRERQEQGRSLVPKVLMKEDGPLAYAARREFGSLRAAYATLGWLTQR